MLCDFLSCALLPFNPLCFVPLTHHCLFPLTESVQPWNPRTLVQPLSPACREGLGVVPLRVVKGFITTSRIFLASALWLSLFFWSAAFSNSQGGGGPGGSFPTNRIRNLNQRGNGREN